MGSAKQLILPIISAKDICGEMTHSQFVWSWSPVMLGPYTWPCVTKNSADLPSRLLAFLLGLGSGFSDFAFPDFKRVPWQLNVGPWTMDTWYNWWTSRPRYNLRGSGVLKHIRQFCDLIKELPRMQLWHIALISRDPLMLHCPGHAFIRKSRA